MMRASMPCVVTWFAVALCLWGSAVAQDPRELARRIVGGSGYQTELPGEGDLGARAEVATPESIRSRRRGFGELAGSGSSGLGYLPWLLVGAAAVAGAVLVVRGSLASGRDVSVATARVPGTPTAAEPAAFDPGALPLEEAERLARQGRFGEAIRVLLLRTFDALRGRPGFSSAPWMTSRQILRRAELGPRSRDGLTALVDAVERSLFARREPRREEFDVCARAFHDLLDDAREEAT